MYKVKVFDSTLRDGAQAEGISFSVQDKINIVKSLDELGIDYIEAGNPSSNPKDIEFFEKMKDIELKNARIAAFGSTRRKGVKASEDSNVKSLLSANTQVCVIFGKSWDFHVKEIIRTSLKENLEMIFDTVSYLKAAGKEVIFDAEHFFDGYKNNPKYALKTLKAATDAGAACLSLCDTNGGCFPSEIYDIIKDVRKSFPDIEIGIHAHNDTGMAVANTVMAVDAGATHIQGTLIGYGERCGNTNLSTVIANLQIKKGIPCIPEENISSLRDIARKIAEISNIPLSGNMPYVGGSAFTHKAGMHIDGVTKSPKSFEHIDPESVGNTRRFLMSEVAGRSTLMKKVNRIDPTIQKDDPRTAGIIKKVKDLEHYGYQFEGAEASFELLIKKQLGTYKSYFSLQKFKTIAEQTHEGDLAAEATAVVKVGVGDESEITAAEGEGPVNALDTAIRKALAHFYPKLNDVRLSDYKVRILDSKDATAAKTRVLIESTDGKDVWTTVGVSSDIIQASVLALVDSIEYKLNKDLSYKEENN